jgi:hypothetical protein
MEGFYNHQNLSLIGTARYKAALRVQIFLGDSAGSGRKGTRLYVACGRRIPPRTTERCTVHRIIENMHHPMMFLAFVVPAKSLFRPNSLIYPVPVNDDHDMIESPRDTKSRDRIGM